MKRFFYLLIVVIPITGFFVSCSMPARKKVTSNYPDMLLEMPYRADRPIARELKYTILEYFYGDEKPDIRTNDSNVARSIEKGGGLFNLESYQSGAEGIKWSDYYSRQAERASRVGDHSYAQHLHGSAITMLQVEQTIAKMEADIQFYFELVGVLRAINEVFEKEERKIAKTVHDWVIASTNSIGESAPEGSVLHLTFTNTFCQARTFSTQGRFTIDATVILEDGSGNILGSSRRLEKYRIDDDETFEILRTKDREDKPELIPKEFIDEPELEEVWGKSINEVGSLPHNLDMLGKKDLLWEWRICYVTLANSMIKEIYAQLEDLKEFKEH